MCTATKFECCGEVSSERRAGSTRSLSPFGWLLEVLGSSLGGHDHVHEVKERLVLGVIDSL
eukprot:5607650-Amphidinium_carterae.1